MPHGPVLIVDDDERNVKLLRDVLRHEGFPTREASTGEEALAIAAVDPPAVVLMDVHLPDRGGVAVLHDLRALPGMGSVPVVAVTAAAMVGDRERLIAAGFDDYVAKPIGVRRLVERVRSLCDAP